MTVRLHDRPHELISYSFDTRYCGHPDHRLRSGSSPSVLDSDGTCALLTASDFEDADGTVSSVSNGEGHCIWSDARGDLIRVMIERPEQDRYDQLKESAEARTGEPDISGIAATMLTEVSASGYAGGVSFTALVMIPVSVERETLVELLERWASA